jgi:hypothetical protein
MQTTKILGNDLGMGKPWERFGNESRIYTQSQLFSVPKLWECPSQAARFPNSHHPVGVGMELGMELGMEQTEIRIGAKDANQAELFELNYRYSLITHWKPLPKPADSREQVQALIRAFAPVIANGNVSFRWKQEPLPDTRTKRRG